MLPIFTKDYSHQLTEDEALHIYVDIKNAEGHVNSESGLTLGDDFLERWFMERDTLLPSTRATLLTFFTGHDEYIVGQQAGYCEVCSAYMTEKESSQPYLLDEVFYQCVGCFKEYQGMNYTGNCGVSGRAHLVNSMDRWSQTDITCNVTEPHDDHDYLVDTHGMTISIIREAYWADGGYTCNEEE